ncbi:MAG TPA: hypothetical protein VGP82_25480 [Ktedonobacterales bacterium]|jgi:hypothetical protein|nr:hypothetical protein [Ktedonobacterales bacterium]
MLRALMILAALTLLLMGAGVALVVNIAQYGALKTRSGGASAQDEVVAMILSGAAELGLLLLLVCAILSSILAMRRHQWGWIPVFAVLAPAAILASLQAGFEADVGAGLAALLAPAVYLLYARLSWRAFPAGGRASRRASYGSMQGN